jgi:nicotinamide riboside transporter PnuC
MWQQLCQLFQLDGLLVQGSILLSGVLGQICVARLDLRGFYFWIGGNILMILVSLNSHLYGMAGLYCFYTVMAFYSIANWKQRLINS